MGYLTWSIAGGKTCTGQRLNVSVIRVDSAWRSSSSSCAKSERKRSCLASGTSYYILVRNPVLQYGAPTDGIVEKRREALFRHLPVAAKLFPYGDREGFNGEGVVGVPQGLVLWETVIPSDEDIRHGHDALGPLFPRSGRHPAQVMLRYRCYVFAHRRYHLLVDVGP